MKKPLLPWNILPLAVLGIVSFSATNVQALSVTASSDGAVLSSNILGSGIAISNVIYTGTATQSGTFGDGISSGIGIESGILLSTGAATDAIGPNTDDGTSVVTGGPGDTDLTSIVGTTTNDAAVLEFDFISAGGNLFFQYAFASEEYNEFTNSSFNDVFAFLLDGVNIALIPGTSTPVSINTVNGGNPFGIDASNPGFYNNNDIDDGGPFFNLAYDGFTDVFMASAIGLAPGTHHIKLAIADTSDSALDSAVFIAGGSFTDIPEPSIIFLFGTGVLGLVLHRRRQSHWNPEKVIMVHGV